MSDADLKRELLALETRDPRLKAEHDRRISEMMEIQLKPSARTGWLVSSIISFMVVAFYAVLTTLTWGRMEWPAITAFIAMSAFSLAWGILAVSIVRRGKIIRALHWTWGIVIITSLAYVLWLMSFMQASAMSNQFYGNMVLFGGLAVLLVAAVVLVLYRMEQTSVKLQEELLRLQLQIADVASGQEGKSG